MASSGFRDGGFRGGFHEGGFNRGFGHDRGFRRFGGFGFYPYDYGYGYGYPDYYDYGYPDYAYNDSYYGTGYGTGDCYTVQRRVHSRSGWHYRPVQVCG
jgi:hypothetical protein